MAVTVPRPGATFDAPAGALRAAEAIRDAAGRHGLRVRAGVHVGEVEFAGGDVRGVAVHEAARIMGMAGAGEILVSETTRVLAQPSGFAFDDRGLQKRWTRDDNKTWATTARPPRNRRDRRHVWLTTSHRRRPNVS